MQLNKFEVGVLVSYAFAYPTVIKGTLTSYDEVVDTCNVEVRSKGTELILFDVPEEFTGRSGPRGFTVSLRVYYPEEDSVTRYPYRDIVTYTREFSVDIGTKNAYEKVEYKNYDRSGILRGKRCSVFLHQRFCGLLDAISHST